MVYWAGRKTRVHQLAGKTPAILRIWRVMKELSVFIDESGDWGEYDYKNPYYIVTMVFHNQSEDISTDLSVLDDRMKYIGCENHCIHVSTDCT